MFNEKALLIPGEVKLGEYQVTIARYTPYGWSPSIPPLNALVSNYRLILQPQTRRHYAPASIPNTYITQVTEVDLGQHRHGLRISLKTGHRMYMFISWDQGAELVGALQKMLVSPVGNAFELKPAHADLERLIKFISGL